MGIKALLGRRNSENRIRRNVRSSLNRQRHNDPEAEIEATLNRYSDRAYKFGDKLWRNSQARKTEGKKLFLSTTKHMIGVTYRGFMGSKKTSSPNNLKIKRPRRK